MTDPGTPLPLSSILVDIELPNPAPFSPALIDVLSSLRVVLIGWYAVPEQTSPEQARDQFGGEARAALRSIAESFEETGGVVQTHVVFTPNQLGSLQRLSDEYRCNAVLIPAAMPHLKRILVPLRGMQNTTSIVPFVADLVQDGTTNVTLLHILEDDETPEEAQETLLNPAAEHMKSRNIAAGLIRREVMQAEDPAAAIVEKARKYDLVVLGETEPSVREILFGTVSESIAHASNVPVIVVRHLQDDLPVESAHDAP